MITRYLPLLAANLRRKRLRTFFTLASIVVAFLLFGLLESLRYSPLRRRLAGVDRLITMHKVSIIQLLPQSYENRIRAIGRAGRRATDLVRRRVPRRRNQIPTFR